MEKNKMARTLATVYSYCLNIASFAQTGTKHTHGAHWQMILPCL